MGGLDYRQNAFKMGFSAQLISINKTHMRYLKLLILIGLAFIGCFCAFNGSTLKERNLDWQGHRGARGLFPENTIDGFIAALSFPIQTLELDCVISKDSQVIVSHEPWMSSNICSLPTGEPVTEAMEDSLLIFQMTTSQIQAFDCGSRGHEGFPDQKSTEAYKPLLSEVFEVVQTHCTANQLALPHFNIEIKSDPKWDDLKTPSPSTFAKLVLAVIDQYQLEENACIQSFDLRALQAVKAQNSNITTAYLIANTKSVDQNLADLGYTPQIYSPNWRLVTPQMCAQVHDKNMEVIPWTVNEIGHIQSLLSMGVDGIITDYPNLIEQLNANDQ